MKLNRKKLNIILPQIKAHLNAAVMQDNQECPGLIDFLYQPSSKGWEPGYLNRLTCNMGSGDDLFGDTVAETLGKPVFINIARLKDALKGGGSEPELKDGEVNGINILINSDDLRAASAGEIICAGWDSIKNGKLPESVKFAMPRTDYELLAGTVSRFVSQDPSRYFMNGYKIDLESGSDFINFAATDGKKWLFANFLASILIREAGAKILFLNP